uniref:translocation/assembly module TamB domain-containing protein n=1 Tax=Flavobacterium sp. TaxID=239 RepID=UPI0040479728
IENNLDGLIRPKPNRSILGMRPEINFDIVLPDGNNDVSTEVINTTKAKLEQIRQQEDVLNKQVFAVLLLNRFIGENPFQSESGGLSATNLAKQSASRILSEQLNQLAGDLVQGFEIDFDLEATEDYSSGQKQDRTDLNVGISKELLDDRLKVTVGSSFGIEGSQNENEQASNIAGDVTAEYLITKDGRYKLKAYRKNNYQVALQGQVIETGVAFIITMNYDKFKELFQKKATKKQ